MKNDPVIIEVRKAKEELAARFGFDVRKLGEHLMKRQQASAARLVSFPPRRIKAA